MLLWFATFMLPSTEGDSAAREPEPGQLAADLDAAPGLSMIRAQLGPLASAFAAEGFRLYLVGGVVRDLMVGSGSDTQAGSEFTVEFDIDLTTDAVPGTIKSLIKGLKAPKAEAVWSQGERFGTIGARLPDGSGGSIDVEITTHRAESYSADSRKPQVAFGTELREDLARRDFTVNAMAIELVADPAGRIATAELRDPFDGGRDLRDRVLRTPLGPEASFSDDPLRMMRAARFMSRFDLTPRPEVEAAAANLADRLAIVSVERVAVELEALLAVDDPAPGLRFLDRSGLLSHIVDAPLDVAQAMSLASAGVSADPAVRLAVRRAGLLFSTPEPGQVLSRLRYSSADRKLTLALIVALQSWISSDHGLADARRAVDRATGGGSSPEQLLALAQTAAPFEPAAAALVTAVGELETNGDLGPYVCPLSGQEIIETLGVEPGPIVGRAQQMLKEHRLGYGPITDAAARRLLLDSRSGLDD